MSTVDTGGRRNGAKQCRDDQSSLRLGPALGKLRRLLLITITSDGFRSLRLDLRRHGPEPAPIPTVTDAFDPQWSFAEQLCNQADCASCPDARIARGDNCPVHGAVHPPLDDIVVSVRQGESSSAQERLQERGSRVRHLDVRDMTAARQFVQARARDTSRNFARE